MTNKELIDILHNIPQEIFQSKNHEKLRLVFHCREPRLKLFAPNDYEVLELTLYESMQYTIWTPRSFEDIRNQVESYLDILGFIKKPSDLYSSARYTPELGVAINSTMADAEIMKLMQLEIKNQIFNALQDKK